MCGILFRLQKSVINDSFHDELWNQLIIRNKQRGPDIQGKFSKSIQFTTSFEINLIFYGAVLHLRGPTVNKQPLIDNDEQDVLLWNGEIFDGIEVPPGENDTKYLFAALKESYKVENDKDQNNEILEILRKIEGPYAIVYWQNSKRKLWFGRDCLGRRSLLWHLPSEGDDNFILTSVGCKVSQASEASTSLPYFAEVPASGIFCLDLNKMLSLASLESLENFLTHYKWHEVNESVNDSSCTLPFGRVNDTLPGSEDLPQLPNPLDVSNHSFIPAISPEIQAAIDKLIEELGDSVKRRVIDIPRTRSISDARVAIMFSGGLDCICLAVLADKYIPKEEAIDLLNVGFENPRIQQAKKDKKKKISQDVPKKSIYNVPDRLTGIQGVEELRKIAPDRIWNFVEVNVPYEEACAFKIEITEVMAPSDTIMDLSIAMAFWFAVRGKGQISSSENPEVMIDYESKARVILVGVGADELLGGYSRHREAFRHGGWQKLIEEIQLDVDRISTRNLGRDDRIISSHSKESRFPYLASNVVSFLCSLPMHTKMDMRYERGIGEKLLLRHVARQLGLFNASSLWKRAIQFGAKTAKMTGENNKEKGNMKVGKE
ncbi:2066_t:CDS:10 [Funneliformis mosseae]|uniref:2066_t:CDS:1 n=1 Tax=Funneliformis mosseae TaxID=27381 RepID=A0A9N9BX48_FUNMO|nr:2066_t:CDS:10 [Funneliformis mosseae]